MSTLNKHHHRKVKHNSNRPSEANEPYSRNSFKSTVSTPTSPNSKTTKEEVANPKQSERYTSAGKDPQTVTEETTHGKKISGSDTSLHMGDTTLQTPEEHKKDQETDLK
ncbi:MAG: hypothetical protein ABW036_10325 [Flavitalea sp.]